MTEETKKPTNSKPLPMQARGRDEVHPDFRIAYNESALTIPEEVTERFKAAGYGLRWIRYRIGEKEDYSNIAKKGRYGWSFVTPEEVPELAAATQVQNFERYSGLVTVEDVALAKCKLKYIAELKKLKAQRAREQLKAQDDIIAKHKLEKEHKTKVTHGTRKPTFGDDNE